MFIAPNDSLGFQAREGVLADLDAPLAGKPRRHDRGRRRRLQGRRQALHGPRVAQGRRACSTTRAKIATPPATTDELLAGVKDGTIKAGFFGGTNGVYHNFGWWAAFGGQLMDDTGKCIADHDRCRRRASSTSPDLQAAGAKFYPNYDDMANAFKAGDIDLIVDGPWATGGYKTAVPTLGVAPMPAGPSGPAQPLDRRRRLVHQPATPRTSSSRSTSPWR